MKYTYRIYGQTLATDFTFQTPLLSGTGSPDLEFTLVASEPGDQQWRHKEPVLASEDRHFFLYCCGTHDVFHFVDLMDFYVFPRRILCYLRNPDYHYQVEVLLLGLVLSYWMERRGICALHASAVKTGHGSIAFLASNTGGKTALAAACTKLGSPLLTDDILAVHQVKDTFMAQPGFPQMRMWPADAKHFIGNYAHLALAHPAYDKRRVMVDSLGDFWPDSLPLLSIYIPQRHENQQDLVRRTRIAPVKGLLALLAHSFAAGYVEAGGMQERRFHLLSALVQAVPVYRLNYCSGLHLLPEVCRKILDWHLSGHEKNS